VKAGLIDPLQRDQVGQSYQSARSTLLQQQAQFQTALDTFRVLQLGLPPDFPITLDDSLLKRFELSDPHIDDLRKENDDLYLSLLQFEQAPPKDLMTNTARELRSNFLELRAIGTAVAAEMERWQAKLESKKGRVGTGPGPLEEDERASLQRQVTLFAELSAGFKQAMASLDDDIVSTDKFLATVQTANPDESQRTLNQLVGQAFRARLSEIFVVQTQTRVFLIDVAPVEFTLDQAIEIALANRQDLMNSQAQVTDAWRNVEFQANTLLAGLNLVYSGTPATAPGHLGILRFDAHNDTNSVGIQFQAPINRRVQRTLYRQNQIIYQQTRRQYMLNHDTIVQAIRLDMRQLNFFRRQFEIGREQLLIASRQVDQAEYNARTSTGASSGAGQSAALNLLNALSGLLTAKNTLISAWVSYEQQRMDLYNDFDVMAIDAEGVWTNDSNNQATTRSRPAASTGEPLPPLPDTPGPFARP
jgi:outer membrane protein TolC